MDSKPDAEWEESVNKGRALFRAAAMAKGWGGVVQPQFNILANRTFVYMVVKFPAKVTTTHTGLGQGEIFV